MSAPKFTPGPWHVNGKQSIRGPAGEYIARANWQNGLANARLIAAVPELYEAVAKLVEWWDREDAGPQYTDPAGRDGPRGDAEQQAWFYGNVNLAGETHKLARAALAKARGEA